MLWQHSLPLPSSSHQLPPSLSLSGTFAQYPGHTATISDHRQVFAIA